MEGHTKVSGLDGEVWPVLEFAATTNISGGSIYDAVIVTEAIAAQAASILTFNTADFERVGSGRLRIVEPQQARVD